MRQYKCYGRINTRITSPSIVTDNFRGNEGSFIGRTGLGSENFWRSSENPYNLVRTLQNNVFANLISINRNFVQTLDKELTKLQRYPFTTDGRTAGMAVVLRAFDMNSDFDLLPRFENLQEEDLNLVRKIIQDSLPSDLDNLTALRRLLLMPRIPEQQVALNEVIQKADPYSAQVGGYSLEGAAVMYKILSHLWPKLSSSQSSSSKPPPQIPPTGS